MTYESKSVQELVAKIEKGDDILTPIEKFCLITSAPKDLGSCLDGVPSTISLARRQVT